MNRAESTIKGKAKATGSRIVPADTLRSFAQVVPYLLSLNSNTHTEAFYYDASRFNGFP